MTSSGTGTFGATALAHADTVPVLDANTMRGRDGALLAISMTVLRLFSISGLKDDSESAKLTAQTLWMITSAWFRISSI
jgi:hypothetical protein